MDQMAILEAIRQELWRGVGRLEAVVEAERERDEALSRNVESVARSAASLVTAVAVESAVAGERSAAAVQLRWEDQLWQAGELALMYFGTARAMAALALANYGVTGSGSFLGRLVAILAAVVLDVGVVLLVLTPHLGAGGAGVFGRLCSCWRRWQRPSRREAAPEPVVEEAVGWMGALRGLWSSGSVPAEADSPV
jgi:hypothetical protein